ncbi:DUF5690 family protein [Roseibacillus ishigakijimensis]|uniref:MFS transporter n=1 Tax=Roseibacillus ishigakijimensis TaxID=454146 RepID=A0A934RVZ1_9BACT|nr:DUF5690 family protein [Roseibacillus ishigakijimensis]MBK1835446.1 hypothetical protein [Roseibacillus ishigakijimensis]
MAAIPTKLSFSRWTFIAVISAFVTYYCMYAFRKPFAVLAFEGDWWGGFALKTAIVTAQLLGYVTAKFLGTKVCSSLERNHVFPALLTCILVALGTLALLAILPPRLGVLAMVINGLSLGMVWGMVMRPLEGRGNSEFLLAGLCCSFIIASGDVKSMGSRVLASDFFNQTFGSDLWMPFATGLIYLLPFLLAAYFLGKVPAPNPQEVESRSERKAMSPADRLLFLKKLALVLIPLALTYFLLTAFRDYRDNFQADLFLEVGVDPEKHQDAFANSERIIAFSVVAIVSLVILIKRHLTALQTTHLVMALSLLLPAGSILLREAGLIDGFTWMILSGLGAYLPYILVHCVIFERLVAFTKVPGNAVFAMMLFDGLGYLGPIIIIPLGDIIGGESRLATFDILTYTLAAVGVTGMVACLLLTPRYRQKQAAEAKGALPELS